MGDVHLSDCGVYCDAGNMAPCQIVVVRKASHGFTLPRGHDIDAAFAPGFFEVLSDAEFSINTDIDPTALGKQFSAKVEAGGTADCQVKPGQTLRVFSMVDTVNIPAVQEGSLPGNSEIMLDRLFAVTNGYKIGDTITVANKGFTVSGYSLLPNFIYIVKSKEVIINDPKTFGVSGLWRLAGSD